MLPIRIERGINEHIFSMMPETRSDARFNILLTYQVQGAYYAYTENQQKFGAEQVLAALDEVTDRITAKPGS